MTHDSLFQIKQKYICHCGFQKLSKQFKTHQNCQAKSDVSTPLILHIMYNTPVVLMLSKRGCLSFEFVSELAKYVNNSICDSMNFMKMKGWLNVDSIHMIAWEVFSKILWKWKVG